MIRLVINADDLGLHPRIDEGIFAAHTDGVVTSATVLATGPTAAEAIRRAGQTKLGLGLHLCLTTTSRPQRPVHGALAGAGRPLPPELGRAVGGVARPAHPRRGDRHGVPRAGAPRPGARRRASITSTPTSTCTCLPGMTSIVEVLAAELGLPMRWPQERPTAHWLVHPRSAMKSALLGTLARVKQPRGVTRVRAVGVFESGRLTEKRLLRLIRDLPEGDVEIVTHPGLEPGKVPQDPDWSYQWEQELAAVLSPRVRDAIAARGIELVNYRQLS